MAFNQFSLKAMSFMTGNDQNAKKSDDDDHAVELTGDDLAGPDTENSGGGEDAAAPAEPQENEAEILNDRILRLAAELENTRRRARRDKNEASQYAIANFARDLLGVVDNFDRALRAAVTNQTAPPEEVLSGLVAGLNMTERELLSVLENHGVKRVSPAGEKFDPNLHQAVAHLPDNKIPAGHVVDVAQPGFTIGERVLRAAMVTVSSGPGEGDAASQDKGNEDEPPSRLDAKF